MFYSICRGVHKMAYNRFSTGIALYSLFHFAIRSAQESRETFPGSGLDSRDLERFPSCMRRRDVECVRTYLLP